MKMDIVEDIVKFQSAIEASNSSLSTSLYVPVSSPSFDEKNDHKHPQTLLNEAQTCRQLLQFLKKRTDERNGLSQYFSPVRIATEILLPFSVQRLIFIIQGTTSNSELRARNFFLDLYFEVFADSLYILSQQSTRAQALPSCLTQSTLQKIIPFAAEVACRTSSLIAVKAIQFAMKEPVLCKLPLALCLKSLSAIESLIFGKADLAMPKEFPTAVTEVTEAILKLFLSALATGSAKKSFQTICTSTVLPLMSKYASISPNHKDMVTKILNEGLFHAEHHFEGYLSAFIALDRVQNGNSSDESPKKKRKTGSKIKFCYQEELFSNLRLNFSVEADSPKTIWTAKLLPLLLELYISQCVHMGVGEDHKGTLFQSKKRKARSKNQNTAFMFWKWCHHDALALLKSNQELEPLEKLAIKMSLKEMLDLVLKHNIYSPSNDTQSEEQFQAMTVFSQCILKMCMEPVASKNSRTNEIYTNEEIRTLMSILSLDHRLLHDNLQDVLGIIQHHLASDAKIESENFFIAVISTYSKLRQLNHFFSSFITFSQKKPVNSFSLLSSNRIGDVLNAAIHGCPSAQIPELWNLCTTNFKSSKSYVENGLTELFIILVQSVSVNSSNFSNVQSLCEAAWELFQDELSTEKIMNRLQDGTSEYRLKVCGFLIELHTKCVFFHKSETHEETKKIVNFCTNEDGVDFSKALASFVNHVSMNVKKDKLSLSTPYVLSLQYLCMQRIRQLHSLLYYLEEEVALGESNEKELESLRREATSLIEFCFTSVKLVSVKDKTKSWTLLTRNVNTWGPYSSAMQSKEYLRWVIESVDDVNHSILEDASFFEMRFVKMGIVDVVFDVISNVFATDILPWKSNVILHNKQLYPFMESSEDVSSSSTILEFDLTCLLEMLSKDKTRLWKKITKSVRDTLTDNKESTVLAIKKLRNLLMLCRSFPSCFFHTNVCQRAKSTSLRLVVLLHILLPQLNDKPLIMAWTEVGFECWTMFGHCFQISLTLANEQESISALTKSSNEWFRQIMKLLEKLNLTDLCNQLLSTLLHLYDLTRRSCSNPDSLSNFIRTLAKIITEEAKDSPKYFSLIHIPLKMLLTWKRDEKSSLDSAFVAEMKRFCETAWKLSSEFSNEAEKLVILGDILRLRVIIDSDDEILQIGHQKRIIIRSSLEKAIELLHSPSVQGNKAAAYFLSTFFVQAKYETGIKPAVLGMGTNFVKNLARSMLESFVNNKSNHDALSIACTSLAQYSSSSEVKVFLDDLSSADNDNVNRAIISNMTSNDERREFGRLHFFRIVHDIVKKEECRKEIVSRTPLFLNKGREMMSVSGNDSLLMCSLNLVCSIISRKDLHMLSSQSISSILCHVSALCVSFSTPASPEVYSGCCLILSSLLKHYTERVYVVIHNFTAALHALLRHILDVADCNGNETLSNCLHLLKLCEGLGNHKEVMKKHVVGLVLAYAVSLQSVNFQGEMKRAMNEVCFSLLDVCTEYETQHMNCLMDTTARIMFRPVFQAYQKEHKYRGQY